MECTTYTYVIADLTSRGPRARQQGEAIDRQAPLRAQDVGEPSRKR